jgi:hypothetical protein
MIPFTHPIDQIYSKMIESDRSLANVPFAMQTQPKLEFDVNLCISILIRLWGLTNYSTLRRCIKCWVRIRQIRTLCSFLTV